MRRWWWAALMLATAGPAAGAAPASASRVLVERIRLPIVGEVTTYRPASAGDIRGVVLFLSGDGGWNEGVVDMARRAADRSLVVGMSFPVLKRVAERSPGRCWYPAGDLETIAQAAEKIYRFPRYIRPILVGYSSGATAVFGALAQAPEGTFAGGISLGFCSDLEVARPLCPRGAWRPSFDARKRVSLLGPRPDLAPRHDGVPRWTLLQGTIDQVCAPDAAVSFARRMAAAEVIRLPKVGHGFSVTRNWGHQYDQAVDRLLGTDEPTDLSHVEPPPAGTGASFDRLRRNLDGLALPLVVHWPPGARRAVIFVSGDGGWADLDQSVSAALVRDDIAVVGWNALRYFWEQKTPGRFLGDLSRVIEQLPPEVVVYAGGYSFGAEAVSAALGGAGREPPAPLGRIAGLVLLAPGPFATFEISPLDWIRSGESSTDEPVTAALTRLATRIPVLCVEPEQSEESGCPAGATKGIRTVTLPGGHHFGGDFDVLAARIAAFFDGSPDQPPRSSGSRRE